MSLFGSMFTGVSALSAQAQSLSMISTNIANVNTVGYKKDVAGFQDLVTQSGESSVYSSGGVLTKTASSLAQQGTLQQTNSPTDLAISGQGLFVVNQKSDGSGTPLYSRAGSFSQNDNGFLENTGGYYLMGWPLDANGNLQGGTDSLSSLKPVNVNAYPSSLQMTTKEALSMNLDSRQDSTAAAPHYTRAFQVVDSLGTEQNLTMDATKTGPNAWSVTFSGPTNGSYPETHTLTFAPDGTISQIDGAAAPAGSRTIQLTAADWGNGSDTTQRVTLDLNSTTQFASNYNVTSVTQDGVQFGSRSSITVTDQGYVVANYTNGQTRNIFKLPIATFDNVEGLNPLSGNAYEQTSSSGAYYLHPANTGGSGSIAASTLEGSNVDLADEFSKMIITQRAYSAASKVISTVDQMLQDLLQTR